jgi:hypothetical protein
VLARVGQVRDDAAMHTVLARRVAAALVLVAWVLVACGQNDTPRADRCTPDSLKTRIWQRGAALADQVPSPTSKP